jgi:hypothetical protein
MTEWANLSLYLAREEEDIQETVWQKEDKNAELVAKLRLQQPSSYLCSTSEADGDVKAASLQNNLKQDSFVTSRKRTLQ